LLNQPNKISICIRVAQKILKQKERKIKNTYNISKKCEIPIKRYKTVQIVQIVNTSSLILF
ncbi:MAG: hypothetical protein PHS74_03205, partial [Lachnospiraceae bacterium]|nr:hypothetical protein [Lachnospiraceae bacterium]